MLRQKGRDSDGFPMGTGRGFADGYGVRLLAHPRRGRTGQTTGQVVAMNNEPLYFAEDSYLRKLVNSAERKRRWYHRINWDALCGALIIAASCALSVWLFLSAYIHVTRWYR